MTDINYLFKVNNFKRIKFGLILRQMRIKDMFELAFNFVQCQSFIRSSFTFNIHWNVKFN